MRKYALACHSVSRSRYRPALYKGRHSMKNDVSPLADSVLAELSRQALAESAGRLGIDPCRLARSLRGGRIAELILTLRHARSWAYPSDCRKIEALLAGIDGEAGDGFSPVHGDGPRPPRVPEPGGREGDPCRS